MMEGLTSNFEIMSGEMYDLKNEIKELRTGQNSIIEYDKDRFSARSR
jgi:hypothetical protein